jgi:hypothetical protein
MFYPVIPTAITTGTRRLHPLGSWGLGMLGTPPDPDTIAELVASGYDQASISMAIRMGATNEQLQALPYPTDGATEANAIAALINQLAQTSTVQQTPQGALVQIPGYGSVNVSLPWIFQQSSLAPQFANLAVVGGGILSLLLIVSLLKKLRR